jgi:hypothetical protein
MPQVEVQGEWVVSQRNGGSAASVFHAQISHRVMAPFGSKAWKREKPLEPLKLMEKLSSRE